MGECVYGPVIVSMDDKGELWKDELVLRVQGTQSLDYYPWAFPFIFLLMNPLLTLNETFLECIGER